LHTSKRQSSKYSNYPVVIAMSEYQYYEFQTIDRPLTLEEQAAIGKLSSRVQLNPTQAIFVYNYGDFRGEPKQILAQYFDIMLYVANWGTWQLIFRLPKAMVDPAWFQPFLIPDIVSVTTTPDYLVLDIEINQDGGPNAGVWGEGWLPQLTPLRDDLLRGDLRLLYITWLRVANFLAENEIDVDLIEEINANPVEPPIPANLGQLSAPLRAFIELVELDPDLVEAAAQASPRHKPRSTSAAPLESFLSELSETERHEYLIKLVRREQYVDLHLINRLRQLAGKNQSVPELIPGHRRLSELEEIAKTLQTERERKEQNAARKKRHQELEALAPKEVQTWERVMELIALKQTKSYEEAVALLIDLRDLAESQERLPEFSQRLQKIKSDFKNRTALMARLRTLVTP
jgi:hypothetical protein